MLSASSVRDRATEQRPVGSGVTTGPADPAVRSGGGGGSRGLKVMAFNFFRTAETQNLMSPDAVSGAPKCSKIRLRSGLGSGPRWGELTALSQTS